jgi:hypothetical protein
MQLTLVVLRCISLVDVSELLIEMGENWNWNSYRAH